MIPDGSPVGFFSTGGGTLLLDLRVRREFSRFSRRHNMASSGGKIVWVGRGISVLASLVFLLSGVMKLKGGPQVAEGFAHLGLPLSMQVPLGILEISCAVIYMVPATSVLGAILLAGYMGGAVCTHWRAGDPFMAQIALGIFVWLGLYLREKRLRGLLPMRLHLKETP
jgi:hypothetical protein